MPPCNILNKIAGAKLMNNEMIAPWSLNNILFSAQVHRLNRAKVSEFNFEDEVLKVQLFK